MGSFTTLQWHRWFAWRPVRVGPRDCRWLEYVERKLTYPEFPFLSPAATIMAIKREYRPAGAA